VNELLWRDFYGYVLYHRPESVTVRNARLLRRAADSPQRSCGR
jgi:deoxyribodipyrimidine photolyase